MDNRTSGDIDLQEFGIRVIRYFKKHFLFLVICIVGGIGLGVLAFFQLPKVYESRLMVTSDILTESFSNRITESLDKLIKDSNSKTLSVLLGISIEEARQVRQLKIESTRKGELFSDKENGNFVVAVKVGDPGILPALQNGIINYLQHNEFAAVRVKQKQERFQTMIDQTSIEIESLEELKKKLTEGKPVYSKDYQTIMMDPTNIHSKILELKKEWLGYKEALELVNSVQVVESFIQYENPTEPNLPFLLMVGFIFGLVVGVGSMVLSRLMSLASSV